MGLSKVDQLEVSWEQEPAAALNVGCHTLFGSRYAETEMTQVWIEPDDYMRAPSKARHRLIFVRKDQYPELRGKVCSTFINCMVLWAHTPLLKTLKPNVQMLLLGLLKENYLIVPLQRYDNEKSTFSGMVFPHRHTPYVEKANNVGIIDMIIGGQALSRERLEGLFASYWLGNANYCFLRYIFGRYQFAMLKEELHKGSSVLNENILDAAMLEALKA